MYSLPAAPILALNSLLRANFSRALAISWTSNRAMIPVTPSKTTSGTDPTLVVTTGKPAIPAWIRLKGVPSLSLVSTTMSAAAKTFSILLCHPKTLTGNFSRVILSRQVSSNSPSPAIKKSM